MPDIREGESAPTASIQAGHLTQVKSTLLENLLDDAIAELYVSKIVTISLYLTKLYLRHSFAVASSVTYNEIHQNVSNSVPASATCSTVRKETVSRNILFTTYSVL